VWQREVRFCGHRKEFEMSRLSGLTLVLVGVALVAGYLIGTLRSGSSMHTGRADVAGDGGGSITTDEWTYGFAADLDWLSRDGSRHEGDQPECLPPGASVDNLRFAAVEVTVEGATWRPVVWVDCTSVPAP
jgi:hypothetical protein